ncbi:DUF4181 domain-containing protein [Priestia flexa]|uniref:DUF4181 domain-containing protein n=1 Tax=Priestia flexa TaxID=86664 RepID=A0ABU4J3S7_9BACI|nr:DUF4181 domain-containing protein [Priestia flexa]AQX54622.1 hypothetical protein BC359_10065 [Priestia flexa]MBY6085704.1 DUF4181 domain-containing protein [Priestia flexa]MCA1201838.1 DUF4181 domain-containing protein [Priestia flexa]MCG7313762.1 DUF4181 domain-containing protein [Priestia flexa]MCM3067236.1 DUF4181 domain-containing protein [Priestia flexa]
MSYEGLIGVILLFILYFSTSHYYLKKRLNIQEKRVSLFSKDRKRLYRVIEGIIVVLFIYFLGVVTFSERSDEFPIWIRALPVCGFFILVDTLRGIEHWMTDKESKSYVYEFLGVVFMLALLVIISL